MMRFMLTACALVVLTNGAQAQSLNDLLNGIFKPKHIEGSTSKQSIKKSHSGGMVRATWYGPGFNGRRTANGERFNPNGMTAAHKTLKFGTRVQFTGPNGRSIVARITDRGPHRKGYTYDLSRGLSRALGHSGTGSIHAKILD